MSADDLTLLCVTQFGDHAGPFVVRLCGVAVELGARMVVGADGDPPEWLTTLPGVTVVPLASAGYIESVLDEAIAACPNGYILRLDDDETISPGMLAWLDAGEYRAAPHWAFLRMHLYPNAEHYILNAPLWPDLQTRLSVKAKAGGRVRVHQGSPHGTGAIAEVAIEHHKFIARDYDERKALLDHYERLQPGAGSEQFAAHSVVEHYATQLETKRVRT